jgi:hypothetical protein
MDCSRELLPRPPVLIYSPSRGFFFAMTNPESLLGVIASTKIEIARHQEILDRLMDDLALMYTAGDLDDIKDDEGNLALHGVKVSRCTRTSWQYSNAVKELQQLEQFEGVAQKRETEYWRVTLPKAEF